MKDIDFIEKISQKGSLEGVRETNSIVFYFGIKYTH